MSMRKLFLTALYRFGSYPELLRVKGTKTFLYSLIMVFFGVAITLASSAPGYIKAGGFAGIAEKAIPEFSITDGHLKMEKVDFLDRTGRIHFYVDTTQPKADVSKVEKGINAIVAGRDEMCVINNDMGQSSKLTFADLGSDLSKNDMVKELGTKEIQLLMIGFFAFFLLVYFVIKTVYDIALLVLMGNIINAFIVRLPVRFTTMFTLAAYARTLPFVMSLVMTSIGGFALEPIVFYAVGAFYMYKGLKNAKNQDGIVIAEIG